jgi:hypothetical protein
MGKTIEYMASADLMRLTLDNPVSYVRNGGSPSLSYLAPDHPLWVTFAEAMVPFIAPAAEAIAAQVATWPTKPRQILDISAGHVIFGIRIANVGPNRPGSPIVTARFPVARSRSIGPRLRLGVAREFFASLRSSGLCDAAQKKFDRVSRRAAVEFLPAEDRVSPYMPAIFAS